MALIRVNAGGWGLGDKFTSAQGNAMDINVTGALDKRAGQTDTLGSVVTLSGAGRIVSSSVVGANSNNVYAVTGGNLIIRLTSALSANWFYTLSTTGAQLGDVICVVRETANFRVHVRDGDTSETLAIVGPDDGVSDGQFAEFYFDGTRWRLLQGTRGKAFSQLFTAVGEWECPRGVTEALLLGIGAGGGGGGGGGGTGVSPGGAGAGGGGALLGCVRLPVTPGAFYTVTVGVGGPGGAGGVAGDNAGIAGNSGTDTVFDLIGVVLATFFGAGGGAGGCHGNETSTLQARGGSPVRRMALPPRVPAVLDVPGPGEGGWGTKFPSSSAFTAGGGSSVSLGGATGGELSLPGEPGGGAGGGASGWPGNVPGTGGNTHGGNGTAGTFGAGGGGGAASDTDGGDGAAGGNGALRIIWWK